MERAARAEGGDVAVGLVRQRLSAFLRNSPACLSHPSFSWTSSGTGSPGFKF